MMEADLTKRNYLFALSITTAVIRTLALTWLSTTTILKLRKVTTMCCSKSLALALFVLSAVIYSTTWLVHSVGILWETISDMLETHFDWNATSVLCGLQTSSLAVVTSGLTAVAVAECLTRPFKKRWTVQVTKIVTIAIYAVVMSLAAFAVTRLSFPSDYGSLLESHGVSSQNLTLQVDLLLCGVDVVPGVMSLLTPAALSAVAAVGIVGWTLFNNKSKSRLQMTNICVITLEGSKHAPCSCETRWSHFFRTTVSISSLTTIWLLVWLLLNAILPVNRSVDCGLALGQHLTIMAAAILAAITPSDVSANEDELLCVETHE